MTDPLNILLLATVLSSLCAAWTDWRSGQIPNQLVVALAALLTALSFVVIGADLPIQDALVVGLLNIALGGLACGATPYLLWRFGMLGGGDVKLLTALGLGLGPTLGIELCLFAFIAAAWIMCLRLIYRGELLKVLKASIVDAFSLFGHEPRKAQCEESSSRYQQHFAPATAVASVCLLVANLRGLA